MNNKYLEKAKKEINDPKLLAIVAAKRAKQLAMGAKPLSFCKSENAIDVALLEIAEGKVKGEFSVPEENLFKDDSADLNKQ